MDPSTSAFGVFIFVTRVHVILAVSSLFLFYISPLRLGCLP